jgi:hypothetical protein
MKREKKFMVEYCTPMMKPMERKVLGFFPTLKDAKKAANYLLSTSNENQVACKIRVRA